MELTSVADLRDAWYRLVGSESDDDGLTDQGENQDDVAFLWLTHGCRAAQNYLIDYGLDYRWRKRSPALSFQGSDATDGGRWTDLPADFLRLWGRPNQPSSALVEPNGKRWGKEINEEESSVKEGNLYYLKNDQLWLARTANLPTVVHLEYYYRHPAINGDASIVFPIDARNLIVAYAADGAKEDGWLPGGIEMEVKITRRLVNAKREALRVARQNRQARRFRKATFYASHW